jgi:ABC-2 type transport system ATP-binding protein
MALGLIFPTDGEVELLDCPMSRGGRDGALRRTGAMIEEPAFYRFLSGRRNLEAFARAGGDGEEVRRRLSRIEEVLEQVGLSTAGDKRVKAYSQGMRQRLGIALALLGRPDLLVLDEPTNGLDPAGMREVRLLLRRLADGGTTVFVSSHLLAEVEAMCDRVGVLSRGRLVAEGPPGNLRGGAEHLRIEVGDPGRAVAILRDLAGVAEIDGQGPVLRVHLDGATAAQVNAALVTGGVAVGALVPERDTLEDVFMSLVEGSGVQG